MPPVILSGDDLDASTLQLYLKDSTFVEYFNSFLLLPAFSSRLFFDQDTGYFEPVHGEGMGVWENGGGITPSCSQATLYLTDENVGPALDRHQSWSWVVEHRLPLFLRSDLFSEYKLCKLLSTQETSKRQTGKLPSPFRSSSSSKLPSHSVSGQSTPKKRQCFEDKELSVKDIVLPSISNSSSSNCFSEDVSTISLHTSRRAPGISTSKSDIELGNKKQASTNRAQQPSTTRAKIVRERSLSVDLIGTLPRVSEQGQTHRDDESSIKLSEKDSQFIGSKSGMRALWKFLQGKAGEKNWLFWLDAERLKYHSRPLDQQRMLRELRERYLHIGGPLELPAEIRSQLRVNKATRLTITQLNDLQDTLVKGLRDYWCPRFLIHHSGEVAITSPATQPTPHSFSRPYSCIPVTLQFHDGQSLQVQSRQKQSLPANYPKISTPLTPTSTPTFRRLTSGRPRSHSSPTSYRKAQEERDSRLQSLVKSSKQGNSSRNIQKGDVSDEGDMIGTIPINRPHTVEGTGNKESAHSKCTTSTGLFNCLGPSRRVWGAQDEPQTKFKSEGAVAHRRKNKSNSGAHFSRVAKYTLRHVPDPTSRCASRLDGRDHDSNMCESRCKIVSVSGTPLHSLPPTPSPHHTLTADSPLFELYTPLITCLNTEQRKAGGYFKQHLENNEEKVFLNCLLFWRDVQEYKALFVGASFSPCAVEMKAKTLHGRFIAESSDESIECPKQIVETVSSNLWPAYEDLFDSAEEHALGILLLQWVEMVTSEDKLFQKLDSAPLNSRVVSGRGSRRGLTSDITGLEELEEEEFSFDGELDDTFLERTRTPSPNKRDRSRPSTSSTRPISRISAPSSGTRRPSRVSSSRLQGQSQATSLNDIINNRVELEHFKVYLNEHYAAQDLMCWMEIEAFRGVPVSDKAIRNIQAKQLKSRYLNKTYLFGPNSPVTKEAQRQIVQAGGGVYSGRLPARPRTPVFIEAQKHVRARLEKKWLADFISTAQFLTRNGGSTLNGNGRRMSKAVGKDAHAHYETSFANSHEAITFRKMLHDKNQVELFLRYLQIRTLGRSSLTTHPKQDVEFWLEVQKYKEMCHAHTTDSMLLSKASAIIDCYFRSSAPPKLQLDIPLHIADQVSRKAQGPYLFREAQAAVFRHLHSCWLDYKNTVNGCTVDEIDGSLNKIRSQLLRAQNAEKDLEINEMLEEERKKQFMPRFETAAEKEERFRKEKEKAEFGDVHVAFRLSNPNHQYTYYTALPDEFIEGPIESPQLLVNADCKASKTTGEKLGSNKDEQVQGKRIQTKSTKNSNNQHTSDSVPVVVLKMEDTKSAKKPQIKRPESADNDFELNVKSRLPLKPDVSNQRLLFDRQSSGTFFHNGASLRSAPRITRRAPAGSKAGRNIPAGKFSPHATISMRVSEGNGQAFPYGGGLPEEQNSHLSIVNVEAL